MKPKIIINYFTKPPQNLGPLLEIISRGVPNLQQMLLKTNLAMSFAIILLVGIASVTDNPNESVADPVKLYSPGVRSSVELILYVLEVAVELAKTAVNLLELKPVRLKLEILSS